ncbi:MAG: hypothetical protein HOM25_14750 [Rhodospirillaceae bacterium]|nr:hypothetical protein [Rhodospirillaceae bacterium]
MTDEFMREHRGQFIGGPFDAVPTDHDEKRLSLFAFIGLSQKIRQEKGDRLAAGGIVPQVIGGIKQYDPPALFQGLDFAGADWRTFEKLIDRLGDIPNSLFGRDEPRVEFLVWVHSLEHQAHALVLRHAGVFGFRRRCGGIYGPDKQCESDKSFHFRPSWPWVTWVTDIRVAKLLSVVFRFTFILCCILHQFIIQE